MSAIAATVRAATRQPRRDIVVLSLTKRAIEQVKALLRKDPKAEAMRVTVKTRGCSGNVFSLEYAQKKHPMDEVVEADGVKVYVEGKSLHKIMNSQMDFEDSEIASGFVFENPNAEGMCGCNESFHVAGESGAANSDDPFGLKTVSWSKQAPPTTSAGSATKT